MSEDQGGWKPLVMLDLMAATPAVFDEKLREFYRLAKDRTVRTDLLATGWHTITPEIAEELLLAKANRRISVAHVQYLARQMCNGSWMRTGQGVIITDDGLMRDAYHRCWACYLSGHSFETFVVTKVPASPHLFAFIDNSKARSAVDALQTAGLNGVSGEMAATIRVAVRHQVGYYDPHRRVRSPKLAPIEIIRYAEQNPTLQEAVREVVSEYKTIIGQYLPHKHAVACYFAWRARDLYGEYVVADFFDDLNDPETTGPIHLLRQKLQEDAENRGRLSERDVLAFLIKTFNAWKSKKNMRRLILGTDEPLPKFDSPDPETEIPAAA